MLVRNPSNPSIPARPDSHSPICPTLPSSRPPPYVPRLPGPHTPQEINIIQAEWVLLQPKLTGILRDQGQAENIGYAARGTVLQISETIASIDVIVVANRDLDAATKRRLESVMEATLDAELSKRTLMVY